MKAKGFTGSEIALALLGAFCVDGETRIQHRSGCDKIVDLVGKEVEVWNGEEWSKVRPYQTGSNQELMKITFSDGSSLNCTKYHNFSIRGSRQSTAWRKKRAIDLKPGDILPTFRIDNEIKGNHIEDAYTYGVFLGDGSIELRKDSGNYRYDIDLYGEKRDLPVTGTEGKWNGKKKVVTVSHLKKQYMHDLKAPGLPEWVFSLNRESTLDFIRGWIDTDGTLCPDGGVRVTSIDQKKCLDLQLLLRRVGISFATTGVAIEAGTVNSFGVRENTLYQVYIPNSEAGLIPGHRVKTPRMVDKERTVKQQRVEKIEMVEGYHSTYCFTEPKRGMGVFNNVLTYQCVIADVCFYFCDSLDECEELVRTATRFLMRVNLMDSVYNAEVKRTNRIGVGLTGIHEFAFQFFGYNFTDLLHEEYAKDFWMFLSRMKRAVQDEAQKYAKILGVEVPHTDTTIKPSGTISKLFGLTEGWHLPAMIHYIRWVQFASGAELVESYKKQGYPVKELKQYKNTTVVGFPTTPLLTKLMPSEKIITAAQATVEEQYKWLELGEKYWIRGVDENGHELMRNTGNQISYTLKYDPKITGYEEYAKHVLNYQARVKCCSIMPQEDQSSYEYLPEQPVSQGEYDRILGLILEPVKEDIGREHLDCGTGGCPVDFKSTLTISTN